MPAQGLYLPTTLPQPKLLRRLLEDERRECRRRVLAGEAAEEWWTPDAFNRESRWATAQAIQVCRVCPIQADCLEAAVVNRLAGVCGGTKDRQRHLIRMRRQQNA